MFDCHFLRSYNQKKRSKKGHSLSYQFECYMEFGDASNEETPPAPPWNKDLTRNLRVQIVSMLQGLENDSSLRRGLITAIAKRFGVAHCTVHCLWKRASRTRARGIINSPEFNSWKKILAGHLFNRWSLFVKVSKTCR